MVSTRTARWLGPIVAVVLATGALHLAGDAQAAPNLRAPVTEPHPSVEAHPICPAAPAGAARCLAQVVTGPNNTSLPVPAATPEPGLHPYGPADLRSAYNLPSDSRGQGQTIAIIDAFDDPNAEADLAVYRENFGLPPCTTDNGCFRKVDQRGGTDYPAADAGWGVEISLDLDMASAICPHCHLLLVESDDNLLDNLAAAVDEAVALGATEVSNSYGGVEADGENELAYHYDHPGVAIIASTGDFGYGVQIPSAYPTVVAVGGTTLYHDSDDPAWHESAWAGSGSGCSAYVAKPRFQHDRLCRTRNVADVAAVADPETGVAVYDTFGVPGWVDVGGTSASAPIIAGVFALAGNVGTIDPLAHLYAHRKDLFDVTSGSNGFCAGRSYLCTGRRGYDGPTGLGTPNGIAAF